MSGTNKNAVVGQSSNSFSGIARGEAWATGKARNQSRRLRRPGQTRKASKLGEHSAENLHGWFTRAGSH